MCLVGAVTAVRRVRGVAGRFRAPASFGARALVWLAALAAGGCLTRLDVQVCETNADCGEGGYCILRGAKGICLPFGDFDAGTRLPSIDGGGQLGSQSREVEALSARTNDTPDSAELVPASIPFTVSGTIGFDDGFRGDVDCYAFTASAGQVLSVSAAPAPGSPADLRVTVVSPATASVAVRARIAGSASSPVARRQLVVPVGGRWTACVEDERNAAGLRPAVGGPGHDYRLEVRALQPVAPAIPVGEGRIPLSFGASSEVAAFRLDAPTPLSLVVATRTPALDGGGALDPALLLVRGTGRFAETVAYSEDLDRAHGELDARIAQVLAPGSYQLFVDVTRSELAGQTELIVSLQAPGIEVESNNTPALATPTTLEAGAQGALDRPGDVDHLSLHARAGDYLVTRARASVGGLLLPRLTVFDDQGVLVAEQVNLAAEGEARLELLATRDADYVVRIADALGQGGPLYGWRLTLEPAGRAPDLLGELGAEVLVRDGEVLGLPGSKRWYRLAVAESAGGQVAVVTVLPAGNSFEPRVTFYGNSGFEALGHGDGKVVRKYLPPGEYWMSVSDQRGRGRVAYQLTVASRPATAEQEPNAGLTGAQLLSLPVTVRGQIQGVSDRDLYAFQASAGTQLRLETLAGGRAALPVDTVLELLDEQGVVLVSDDDGGLPPFSRILDFAVPRSGRYYARVSPKAGASATQQSAEYVLVIDSSACSAASNARAPQSLPGALVFNEVLYAPARGLPGDANLDGVADGQEDAFVELLNASDTDALELGGVTLEDDNSLCDPSGRHVLFTFPCGARLEPGRAAVIFGGGSPNSTFGLASVYTSAFPDRCRLDLDPSAESLRLRGVDGSLLASFSYPRTPCDTQGCTCVGVSCSRFPDGVGPFRPTPSERFSPGRRNADGAAFAGLTPAANDLCTGAQTLSPGVEVSGDGRDASNNEQATCGSDGPELFYTFTLSESSDVELSASGARALSLRTDCSRSNRPVGELKCSASSVLSVQELLGDPVSPRVYYVAVDSPGPFTLRLTTTPVRGAVANDRCALATLIAPGDTLLAQTTVGATFDYPRPAGCGRLPSPLQGPDVAYRMSLRAGQTIDATVLPAWPFDAAMFVVSDCAALAAPCLAASDIAASGQPESLRFTAATGGDYFLIVGSYASFESGQFDLLVREVTSP